MLSGDGEMVLRMLLGGLHCGKIVLFFLADQLAAPAHLGIKCVYMMLTHIVIVGMQEGNSIGLP